MAIDETDVVYLAESIERTSLPDRYFPSKTKGNNRISSSSRWILRPFASSCSGVNNPLSAGSPRLLVAVCLVKKARREHELPLLAMKSMPESPELRERQES